MKWSLTIVCLVLFTTVIINPGHASEVYIIEVADAISPGVAEYIEHGIETASQKKAACVIVVLDTPGGLAEAMRSIVKTIYESPVPVVVYVAPSGARAASAGVMVTMAADIAAMAPGTNIGAAHPVGVGGKEIEGAMSEKVVNDMAAQAKSIAQKRGRNTDWAEKAVRESVSVTETEALELNVIDLVAKNLDDLIGQIHGREIPDKGILDVENARQIVLSENFRSKVLRIISNPNIAYILLMIGLAGLYFELSHPGAIFPGVIGGISLILAFYSLQTLPVSIAGILLIVLSMVFFIMELKITSYGLLSIAGVISLTLGSLMLFEGDSPAMRVSLSLLVPTVLLISGFFIVVASLVYKVHTTRPRTGISGLIDEIGIAKTPIDQEGKVLVHGELWKAVAHQPIPEGTQVRVVAVENLVVTVEPLE